MIKYDKIILSYLKDKLTLYNNQSVKEFTLYRYATLLSELSHVFKKGGFSLSTNQVDRRIRRSKRLLQQSLLDLMIHCDLEDITVTDIVNHADYNRSTFYRHYDHKEQIADEIITDQLNKLIDIFRTPYKKHNHIQLHKLSPNDINIFVHIYHERAFYSLWHRFVKLPGFKEAFVDSLSRFFKDEIVLVARNSNLNDTLYTAFYANGILGIIVDWIEKGLTPSPDYMAKQLMEILNHYPGESYIRGQTPVT